jgi:hypothetical protein
MENAFKMSVPLDVEVSWRWWLEKRSNKLSKLLKIQIR